jgi:hypothetical protein
MWYKELKIKQGLLIVGITLDGAVTSSCQSLGSIGSTLGVFYFDQDAELKKCKNRKTYAPGLLQSV